MTPAYASAPIAQPVLETNDGQTIPLRYSVQRLPDDADGQVAATIARMGQYVCEDCQSAPVRYEAQCAIAANPNDPLAAIHSYVRSRMRFKRDEETCAPYGWMLPKDGQDNYFVEALIRPIDVCFQYANTGTPVEGDCDDFSQYTAALMRAAGIDCCFVTVGANPDAPNVFSHVYTAAYYRGGRTAMDCSHGPYAGWEAPNRYGKFKEWAITDNSSLGLVGLGIAAAAWWAWKNRREIKGWLK